MPLVERSRARSVNTPDMLPTGLKGPPEVKQLQVQLQQATQITQKLFEELATVRGELKNKDTETEAKVYDAITARMKVLQPQVLDPHTIALEVAQLMAETHNNAMLNAQANLPDAGE